jgi:NTE family protein
MAASEMSDRAIKEILFDLRKSDFWDPDPVPVILKQALRLFRGYPGYLRGNGFGSLLKKIPIKRVEDCPVPLIIAATNLTHRRADYFTRGSLIKAIQASGSVPMLFKPVEMDGSLYVDGGMVSKAPVEALAELIKPDKMIIHFVSSSNLRSPENAFLKKKMTPWHIHHLSVSISRQEAYERQCERVVQQGIGLVEVKTGAPSVGPNSLAKGPAAYSKARQAAIEILSEHGF